MNVPIISPDNSLVLWAIIVGGATLSIVLEQKYKWAATVSGAIIALVLAMALSNIGIIPTASPTYDVVWNYIVPLAIPLLLMKCDIRKIGRESGRLLILFLAGSVGTMLGAFLSYFLFQNHISELPGIAAMITGSYIGGSVNLAALSSSFSVSGTMVSATTVADNLLMALYFFVLISIPSIGFFRKHFRHPYVDKIENMQKENHTETITSSYWKPKEISLKDIACSMATTFIIFALSQNIAIFFSHVIPTSNEFLTILNGLLGNQYLIITTISMLCASVAPKIFGEIAGTQEIGTFLIYLFFFVIGVPASLMEIIQNSPLLLVFCAVIVIVNMAVEFLFGKLLKFNLEDIILASNANIGGPTTAVAMAISKGWIELVGPIMLVGTLGYIIGTYAGTFVGTLLLNT